MNILVVDNLSEIQLLLGQNLVARRIVVDSVTRYASRGHLNDHAVVFLAEINQIFDTARVDALDVVCFGKVLYQSGAVDNGVNLFAVELSEPVLIGNAALDDRYSVFKVPLEIVLKVVVQLTSESLLRRGASGASEQAVNVTAVVVEEEFENMYAQKSRSTRKQKIAHAGFLFFKRIKIIGSENAVKYGIVVIRKSV